MARALASVWRPSIIRIRPITRVFHPSCWSREKSSTAQPHLNFPQSNQFVRPKFKRGKMNRLYLMAATAAALTTTAFAADKVDFAHDVKPILEKYCLSCHGEEKPKGGLRLTT